jgi:aminopeptidase N
MIGTDTAAPSPASTSAHLRQAQFPEDAGPMRTRAPGLLRRDQQLLHRHVYEKGAEVVRMYQTLWAATASARAWTCTSSATTARP